MPLTSLNQDLLGSTATPTDINKPSQYTPLVEVGDTTTSDQITNKTNVRHYTMLIWLNEEGSLNEDEDGKIFTAGISFSTGGESGGVTAIIAAAN